MKIGKLAKLNRKLKVGVCQFNGGHMWSDKVIKTTYYRSILANNQNKHSKVGTFNEIWQY